MAFSNMSNASLQKGFVRGLANLLSYPSDACAAASQAEFLNMLKGVLGRKYGSIIAASARNASSCNSFFLCSKLITAYVVISAPVPKVVGIKILGTPVILLRYLQTSIELPPPRPI